MRSKLSALLLLTLAVAAPAAFADSGANLALTAPEPIATVAPAVAGLGTCLAAVQPLNGGFLPACGDPCGPNDFDDYCVGYDCDGMLRIDQCSCWQSQWTCHWQRCPRW